MSEQSRFAINLDDVKTERQLIPPSVYEGIITKGEVRTGVNDEGAGWLGFSAIIGLSDPDLATQMSVDTPKVFFNGFLSFDKDTGVFLPTNSPEFGVFVQATGLKDITLFEEGTENCETSFDYMSKVLENMMDACVGIPVTAKVVQVKSRNDSSKMVNDVPKITAAE